jgi:hypothetical protein
MQLLATGKPRSVLTILRAHMHFYRGLPLWLRKRRASKVHRAHRNTCGIYGKSVIWQYFALRKKTFPRLKWTPKPLSEPE